MRATTKLSTKGQIVLPHPIRAAHRWAPGVEFTIQDRGGGILLTPKRKRVAARSWETLRGCAGYRGRRISIAEMDEAIAALGRARGRSLQ